jgi:hypothetical protein
VVGRALLAEPPCPGLELTIADWDRVPSPLWRKRIARHIRACARCGAQQDGLIPAERLLAGLTMVPLPGAMARAFVPPAPGARAPATRVHGSRALRRAAGHSRHARILSKAGGSVPAKLAAVTVAQLRGGHGAAVVHLHGAHPAAATRPVRAVPAPPPTPVTQALARSSPKPVWTTRPPRKPAPPAPASNAKKGVAAWAFAGAGQALAQSGASWYYTWSVSPAAGVSSPGGPRFVPLIWGSGERDRFDSQRGARRGARPAQLQRAGHERPGGT